MSKQRLTPLCLACLVLGCAAQEPPPPPIVAEQREAIRDGLVKMGAKLTAEHEETIWLSLRNTHVEVGPVGGAIECAPRKRKDIQDFLAVAESVASHFLEPDERPQLHDWLAQTSKKMPTSVQRVEYDQLKVSLSRRPLRALLSRKEPAGAVDDDS